MSFRDSCVIRHCVFIKFKSDVSSQRRQQLFDDIDALKHHLPGILGVHIAKNTSPEIGMDKGFSQGFIIDFEDAKSRDIYLEDPRHKQAGANLVNSAEGGVDGILVYDMKLANVTS